MQRLMAISGFLLVAVGVGSAPASMTPIYPPTAAGELGHEAILEHLYGQDFTDSGPDYLPTTTGGAISALRVEDALPGFNLLDVVTGDPDTAEDKVWGYGEITATARARFAGYSQQLGINRGSGYENLFNVSGWGFDVTGSGSLDLSENLWTWVRRNTSGSNAWYSEPSYNSDDLDHMVTYRIEGLDTNETVWLLFWEDLPGDYDGGRHHDDDDCDGRWGDNDCSDRDFNDLVVEVRATPEPATLVMLLAGVPMLSSRRNRNRWS